MATSGPRTFKGLANVTLSFAAGTLARLRKWLELQADSTAFEHERPGVASGLAARHAAEVQQQTARARELRDHGEQPRAPHGLSE
jgi:hypothetical protein